MTMPQNMRSNAGSGTGSHPLGRVVTFYSYKGGTGRSMALANVAWMLALSGYRVLVVDWDLEAPGIHRYFHPFLEDKELLQTDGLLDFVEKLAVKAATSPEPLPEHVVDVFNYISPLEWPVDLKWHQFGENARLDLLVAGRQGPSYSTKLNSFNWIDFYTKLGGRRLIDITRSQLCEVYDYVLIDSRTGVSDTSGICTVEMPDTLVLCFTLNDQSIKGVTGIADSVLKQVAAKSSDPSSMDNRKQPFRIFPVPTRVEVLAEKDKLEAALDLAKRTFSGLLEHLGPSERSKYWGAVQITYFPFYAFEEILAVFGDLPYKKVSLTESIRGLTAYLTNGAVTQLKPLEETEDESERLRKEILSMYLRRQVDESVAAAEAALEQLPPHEQQRALHVLSRLVYLSETGTNARPRALAEFGAAARDLVLLFAESRVLTLSGNNDANSIVALRDPGLIEKWDRLKESVEADREFLYWRQNFEGAVAAWVRSNKDDSALLRGALLSDAQLRVKSRMEDLNGQELAFINASEQFETQKQPGSRVPAGALSQTSSGDSSQPARKSRVREILRLLRIPLILIFMMISGIALYTFYIFIKEQKQRNEIDLRQKQADQELQTQKMQNAALAAQIHDLLNKLSNHDVSARPTPAQIWGIVISADTQIPESVGFSSSAEHQVTLAIEHGYSDIALYHHAPWYQTVLLYPDRQSATDTLKAVHQAEVPTWQKAYLVKISTWCVNAKPGESLKTKTLVIPMYECHSVSNATNAPK